MTRRLGAWQAYILAALFGAGAAFGQQPYDLPPLMLLGMIGAAWLFAAQKTPRQAALTGWAFGLGYFMHALQWIVSPFMVDVARHGWMAPFALVFLAAGMALFWGVAFWGARKLSRSSPWALIPCWAAAELVRAYLFTGFPWASPAQSTVSVIAGQALAWVGPHGLNAIVICVAVCAATAFTSRPRWPWRLLREGVVLATLAALLLPVPGGQAPLSGHTIRLVQPNAAQKDKWDADKIPVFFQRQLQYTAAPPEGAAPDLVLWSETAIPWNLEWAGTALQEIARAGGDTPVALGVQRSDDLRYFNAMITLDQSGAVTQTYDKHHLVPFGEYMPLGDVMARFGIYGLAANQGHGYTAGPGARLLDFGPLGRALPLICYEAVFAHDVNAASERPDFLIQITNDAWFGRGAGPRQHLAQARMRAIEQGLPLARVANTGISAMIDPQGRVTASLPLNTAGFLDAALPAPGRITAYRRKGDAPAALFVLLALAACGLHARRRGQARP
ncbi:Apolipoprotein N-acyltransferase [Sulfitobacter sp. THAF37]|uniref:apolipoprotein N-acyltransferase n=1 Tax=Sulfitobacter sp. THAF37 TaxID=2587855 RepID=UPI001268043C|nr:apolipoprotein N-acyltransferase [Sulfitobacter sp. THAF37]QFT57357.1 Apolipoprotein N-acyltransferase [Sulfitobacter sp. THAF37]